MSRTNVVAVVVAYNRQELLRRCLDGLADQTVALMGAVVVDNASTDASGEVASTHRLHRARTHAVPAGRLDLDHGRRHHPDRHRAGGARAGR